MTEEKYFIRIGMRRTEFTYSDLEIFGNIKYFKQCHREGMSAYKALLFLKDYIEITYKF